MVVDAGAHIGVTSIIISTYIGATGKIYAFEPDTQNYNLLCKNIRDNNIINIMPIKNALGDKEEKLDIYRNSKHTGYNSLNKSNIPKFEEKEKVDVITIDNFCAQQNITPNFIKTDCQGYDAKILMGARNTLKNMANGIIYAEFWPEGIKNCSPPTPEDFLRFIQNEGMRIIECDIDGEDTTHEINNPERFIYKIRESKNGYANLLIKV